MLENMKENIQVEQTLPVVSLDEKPIDCTYKIYTLGQLYTMEFKPIEWFLYPFIQDSSINLVFAERGAGKTFFLISIAMAIASGWDFLRFKAETPRKVLYVDGEMDHREMLQRFKLLENGFKIEGKNVNHENLHMFLYGLQGDNPMPDISKQEEWQKIDDEIEKSGAQVVIMDNISCLYTVLKENESGAWKMFNAWSLRHRRKGRAIIWVHHTGKDKTRGPRGSSSIETHVNNSLFLGVPYGHEASDGAVFDAEYTKNRGQTGDIMAPFRARLSGKSDIPKFAGGGWLRWKLEKCKRDLDMEKVKKARDEGKTFAEIEELYGIPSSTAQKWVGKGSGKKKEKKKKEDTNTQEQSLATE